MYPQVFRDVIVDLVLLCQRVVSAPAHVQKGVLFLDDVATYVKEWRLTFHAGAILSRS
jgi:hypothetical protein